MKQSSSQPIIQGGMGVNISNWLLAKTVAINGQRGTISGVALERVMVYQLHQGDIGGHIRRALEHFPFPELSEKIIKKFFRSEKNHDKNPFSGLSMINLKPNALLISAIICANFAYTWLAKEGHDNPISINYLEKVSIPHVYAICGSMLAGVDYITMGAGLPFKIPEVINGISDGRSVSYNIPVYNRSNKLDKYELVFDPEKFFGKKMSSLPRPGFLPIISSNTLAEYFKLKLPFDSVTGLIVEGPSAGGHNAPVREITYQKIADHGWPFWIGGSCASPEKLSWAKSVGAVGVQLGSIFALSNESGMEENVKRKIRQMGFNGLLKVRTDTRISPTGYPFKVLELDGTISNPQMYQSRHRVCNQGALVTPYEKPDGSYGYRCPAEPVDKFVFKGGKAEEANGRGCLCNGLNATAGIGYANEPMIVTIGDDLSFLQPPLMKSAEDSYSVADAINYLTQ